ncbi:SDR family NAD(P)-dependent oxidoreductase [Mammaliicoccus stepanovicii]|uniref:3-oxoacyl-[acyl-carrier-protein] reductase FabG n=1 Tax=Mammaliicoccus stepanovicii TaxID=643214 RepID=A0A239YGT5_9STAP|nr:SDR family NAD(P)-dependent oxidoreductase [Mammaliicoccus stepanovicii]PNZ75857.1 3-oxoacyl-ACP reductase [Mammaliicoccus stepanovicii]GGI42765.1 3-ketoacyl-ACP reductase [Mammaliicoccus stepanovicii]SNV57404.1 Short-chain alcohol dehydrogenase [Mammaliicoccus stepanovicii]
MLRELTGLNAIITGGSKGIGKSIAIALAQEGVNVAIASRSLDLLEETANELKQYNVKVFYKDTNIAHQQDVQKFIEDSYHALGSIDIVINNAGIMKNNPFLDVSESEFDQLFETNVKGIYYVLQESLPYLVKQNSGDVINIASMSGLKANANSSIYAATKYAVIGMTEGIMQEMRKHNIRVSYLTPSAVLTDLIGETPLEEDTMTHPEDVADVVIAQLKLQPRTFMKTAQIWATNPTPKQ